MTWVINIVKLALADYVSSFIDSEGVRFALLNLSLVDPVIEDFTDIQSIIDALVVFTADSGDERTNETILYACSVENGLSWRPETNKLVFVFTDEWPQTKNGTGINDARDVCIDNGMEVYVWSNHAGFNNLATSTGGEQFPLALGHDVREDLTSILEGICK